MLSGARNHKNTDVAEKVFNSLQLHFPEINKSSIPASLLLSNMYASSGNMDKALAIRNQIQQSGIKKEISLSWTVINDKVLVSITNIFFCSKQNIYENNMILVFSST